MTALERLSTIQQRWFLQESALFAVLCIHDLVPNRDMACPMRCGRGRIEYNPEFIDEISDEALEALLKVEAIRILLKHPYSRVPSGCGPRSVAIGSNLAVSDNYPTIQCKMERPGDYWLDRGKPFEWYARRIEEKENQGESLGGEAYNGGLDGKADLALLWGEDHIMLMEIDKIIEKTTNWGSLSGMFVEKLKASTKSHIDWRKALFGFRASVLSSTKKLTRMKPNRRTGFQNMGSTRRFNTKILVAVDTSGSIDSKSLQYFFGVINSAFKYGIEVLDVVQFDCGIRAINKDIKRAKSDMMAVGRGGTDFQAPIDYAIANNYDGLVILTDGYAPEPVIPVGAGLKIIWVCDSQQSYNAHQTWMKKSGRVCTMQTK